MEINIQNVSMTYPSGKQALQNLSLELRSPSLIGLLGPNGAGKSTLMKLLVAALLPTSGSILVDGQPLLKTERQLKAQLGYLPQDFGLFNELTVAQFLDYMAALKGLRDSGTAVREVIRTVNLEGQARARIRSLSGGQRQRVGIAQALLGDPKVIILDEPTVGLDPRQIIEIRDLIQSLGKRHTVILSSHILSEVQAVCHTILIISGGRLVACDTPENLEKLFAGTTTVELTAECTDAEARAILAHIPAENLTVTAQDKGRCQALLETGGDDSVCRDIFFAFSRAGRPILRMTTARASLEDIFIELTAGQADVQVESLDSGVEDGEFRPDDNALLDGLSAPGKEDDEA